MELILFGIGMCILLAAGLFYFIYKSLVEIYEKIDELDIVTGKQIGRAHV